MNDSKVFRILAGLALSLMLSIAWQQRERLSEGANDFMAFYAGATLVESGNLYDHDALIDAARRHTGRYSEEQGYIRPPFHAAFLRPFTWLPYKTAYAVWETLSLLAVVGFIFVRRPPEAPLTALLTFLSFPVFAVLLYGQDVNFLLLTVAVTERLYQGGKPAASGAVFSLCAAKFHLFLLTPALILARRDWRFLKGLLGGGAALAAISFLAAGWNWPLEFIRSATDPRFSPGLSAMPNLHGALSKLPASAALEIALSATVVAATWLAARKTSFRYGFAASLVGGVLLSRHCYLLDTALLLPAGLAALALSKSTPLKLAAVAVLTPAWAIPVGMGYPYSALATALVVALLYGMAAEGMSENSGVEALP